MSGNDVPIEVLLDRRTMQLEHAEATATRRKELLKDIESELAWCPLCHGVEPSTGGGIEHIDNCRLAKELST